MLLSTLLFGATLVASQPLLQSRQSNSLHNLGFIVRDAATTKAIGYAYLPNKNTPATLSVNTAGTATAAFNLDDTKGVLTLKGGSDTVSLAADRSLHVSSGPATAGFALDEGQTLTFEGRSDWCVCENVVYQKKEEGCVPATLQSTQYFQPQK
ncbi:MAG: hypothetical protein M1837_000983 [Sclerophora amabilis]|nr:MAG: hypothetical protein M1837_000983 [Sclerophora amabilis]